MPEEEMKDTLMRIAARPPQPSHSHTPAMTHNPLRTRHPEKLSAIKRLAKTIISAAK